MKSEIVFVLENAAWPALLTDGSGVVRRINREAQKLFGAVMEVDFTELSAVWSPENKIRAEAFLPALSNKPEASTALKFRVRGGETREFTVQVCSLNLDGQVYHLFQMMPAPVVVQLPPPPPPPAPPPTRSQPVPVVPDPAPPASPPPPAPPAPLRPSPVSGTQAEANPDSTQFIIHRQKLDCALKLARTVALDFNNALTSILGHTSLVLSKVDSSNPWRSSLIEIEKSAQRAAEIAHDLAAFSRQEKETRTQVAGNLNDLVRRSVELLQKGDGQGITWKLHLEGRLFSVNFDEAKMQQALLKIMENSIQASEAGGDIVVLTRNRDIEAPCADGSITLSAGRYVCVEISDHGCGIPEETLPRVFEPFFTTKTGRRGLGLAWVYGIITNHGGLIAVSSGIGLGTSVRIYLPAQQKIVHDTTYREDDLKGHQTILFVDDEDMLLNMAQAVLNSYGYKVLIASSGEEALKIIAKYPTGIDLVITDLVMPQMSGRELIEHLRVKAPQMRIICSSGYVQPGDAEKGRGYLQKPFTSQDLVRKVKQALT